MSYQALVESYKGCRVVSGFDTVNCCTSCHEDVEYGYCMCWVEIDGKDYEVCCRASELVAKDVT